MLVLSRHVGEEIVIGHGIVVEVRGTGADAKVRLGIQADPSIPVHRREVYDAIQRQEGKIRPPAAFRCTYCGIGISAAQEPRATVEGCPGCGAVNCVEDKE